jgi:hypothetical protein
MRKSTLIVAFAAALLLLGTGCESSIVTLEKPNVTSEAINDGGALRLTWTAVTDAKSYEITTDDSVYTTTSTSFDVTTPSRTIEVRAISGSDKSDPATINMAVVETPTVDVYGYSEPDTTHHSGFGFNTDGTVATYSLNIANFSALDFFADDVDYPGKMYFINPGDKLWNTKGNAGTDAGTTDFDNADLAPAPGVYSTQFEVLNGGVYYLWLDRTNNGWDADDNYAKVKITSIAGAMVTMQVAYQKVGGLRWLMK